MRPKNEVDIWIDYEEMDGKNERERNGEGSRGETKLNELLTVLLSVNLYMHLPGNAVQGLRSLFMAIGGTGMLVYTSPTLALVSLSVIPPVAVGARFFGKYVKNVQVRDREMGKIVTEKDRGREKDGG